MNTRYTLAAVLLLSTLPQVSFSAPAVDYACKSDLAALQCDCRSGLQKLAANDTDIEVALAYLLSKELPAKYDCSFDVKGRTKKAAVKYFINRFLLHNALDVVADVPSVGQVSVLTTDQALEVSFVALDDILAHKSASDILVNAVKKYGKEKVVAALVWLVEQTNVESLLPDALTDSGVYYEARNELARYGVDKLTDKFVN